MARQGPEGLDVTIRASGIHFNVPCRSWASGWPDTCPPELRLTMMSVSWTSTYESCIVAGKVSSSGGPMGLGKRSGIGMLTMFGGMDTAYILNGP